MRDKRSIDIQEKEKSINEFINSFIVEHNYIPSYKYIGDILNIPADEIKQTINSLIKQGKFNSHLDYPTLSHPQFIVMFNIENYIAEHGYSPSIRELCDLSGLSSTSTVHGHIRRLVKKGLLRKKDMKPRTVIESQPNILRSSIENKTLMDLLKNINLNEYIVTGMVINEMKKAINVNNIDISSDELSDYLRSAIAIDSFLNKCKVSNE